MIWNNLPRMTYHIGVKKFYSGTIGTVLLVAVAGAAGYFGNLELQSYWGRKAIAETGLRIQPLNRALEIARSENKMVLVDVSAVWCGTCRKLDNEIFSNPSVKKVINERFVYSRLEYETPEGEKFLSERNVNGVPNLWVVDGEGNNVKRLRVTFDPDDFIEQLQ